MGKIDFLCSYTHCHILRRPNLWNMQLTDKSYIINKIKQDSFVFGSMDETVRNDKDIVLTVLQKNRNMWSYVGQQLRNDKNFIMEMIQVDSRTLYYASESLRNDKEVIISAVQKDGNLLDFAGESLKNDKYIVSIAIQSNFNSMEYASVDIKKDKLFVMEMLERDCRIFHYIDQSLRDDKDIVTKAVERGLPLPYIGDLKDDECFMKSLAKYTIFAYRYVDNGLLTGKQYNKLFKDVKLRKKLKDGMLSSNGFKYKIGINKDTVPFNTRDTCCAGGLYCTTEQDIHDFPDKCYGTDIYEVRIPDEAQVYIEGPNKLKADMLEIVRKIN
jgi:hypothetical protein